MAERDQLLNHNYDGIKEYDNDLPRWWVQLFWITAIGGIIYAVWFHFIWGSTPHAELAKEMQLISDLRAKDTVASSAQLSDETLFAMAKDSGAISKGQAVFMGKCLACHGAQGGGIVGPNLTDDYWIHGGKPLEIRKIIIEGVAAKGMIPWGTQLPPDDINAVTAFVLSLHGTNPAGAKGPEGSLVAR